MEVVRHQCPSKAFCPGRFEKARKTPDKIAAIIIVGEDVALFNSAHDNVLEKVWNIYAGGAWHGGKIAAKWRLVKFLRTSP